MNRKTILLILGLAVAAGAGIGYYLYNMKVPSLASAEPDFKVSAEELYQAYSGDEASASSRYNGKIVQVSGTVRELSNNSGKESVIFESGDPIGAVVCEMDSVAGRFDQAPAPGGKASVVCECTGMLMDVVLVRCVPAKK